MVALPAILKIYFDFFLIMNQKASWLQTSLEVSRWLIDQK